ncbi:GIY-YIG nuclease family protein [Streptomyces chartreusis]|uniref:GIY-YIG nuclease family protein n=1 Tax=Streptomyces chartreusis TaxID=1969 RepID=UPI002E18E5F0
MPAPQNVPTALYRLHDDARALLYIGITNDLDRRFEQHQVRAPWWPRVRWACVEWFPDRPSALLAEAAAIRAEDPEHNGHHSPRRDWHTARDAVADDQVREVSMSLARGKLTGIVRQAAAGTPAALLEHGQRQVVLVTPEWYDRALRALGES